MKRSVGLWQLWGFAVTSLGGTLLHFLFEWLGRASWIAPFSAVNESTWEHMKLLFWPMLIFALIQSRFFRDRKDFWCVKLKGALLGLCLIPIIFYTYNGVIGKSPDWINISIFFITAITVFVVEARLLKAKPTKCKHPIIPLALLLAIGILFVIFTFRTPELGIFKDPVTGQFGF